MSAIYERVRLKLIYNFKHLWNFCRGNLKITEIVNVIEPWME